MATDPTGDDRCWGDGVDAPTCGAPSLDEEGKPRGFQIGEPSPVYGK